MADKKRERFSPLFIADIRGLWESGRFSSVEDFKTYGDATFKKFPSIAFVNKQIQNNGWDKTRTVKDIEAKTRASYDQLFEKEGMGDAEAVKRICEGIRAPERTVAAIAQYAKANNSFIDDETLKKFADRLDFDLRTAAIYLAERSKMVGAYAATKQKITAKIASSDVSNLSAEEAAAQHARIHRNFVAAGLFKVPQG